MSRRRTPRKRASQSAPHDGTPLGHLSEAALLNELARRRMGKGPVDLDALEDVAVGIGLDASEESPKCGKPVPVKTHNRVRRILTTAGELRLARNYHYCRHCRLGFHPRDLELKLPSEGEVSSAMERRILDFGINDTFAAAAERWSIHYPAPISENLVRRVVDRVGRRCEAAHTPLLLQQSCRPTPEEPARTLVVGGDGSMLLTREDSWREAKLAVVARGEDFVQEKSRRNVNEARYVAEFAQDDFRRQLAAALEAERADEVQTVVYLGDGARENWKMAEELCPFAIQVLDLPHAIQNGMVCGKALLGEDDAGLPLWEARLAKLLDADSPGAAIRELLDCLPEASDDAHLAALDALVRYYRTNETRMRYATFRAQGLPVGSGIVESGHRHVLQVRMKRAGQRWSIRRAKRMARLRAAYRTAGPRRFHRAIHEAHHAPPPRQHRQLPNGPRRAKHRYHLHRGSPLNRAAASI